MAERVTEVRTESLEFYLGTVEEVAGDGNESTYSVEFLRAGLTADGKRFYPPAVLKRAAESGVFDGRKMYSNHASAADQMRGYRDVEDWRATIVPGSVHVTEAGHLRARASVCSSSLREKLENKHARAEMGISHDSQYRYRYGDTHGPSVEEVTEIVACNSVDWVPEGNAFGRVLEARRTSERNQPMEGNVQEGTTIEERFTALEAGLPDMIANAVKAALAPAEEPEAEVVAEAATDPNAELRSMVTELQRKVAARDALDAVTDLPDAAKARVLEAVVTRGIEPEEALKAERDYIDSIVKESGGATRITGAGSGEVAEPTEYTKENVTEAWIKGGMSKSDADSLWAVHA